MIVWLASYPRSGNTFLRAALHGLYGCQSIDRYTANRPLSSQVPYGFSMRLPKDTSLEELAKSNSLYAVKTHDLPSSDCHPAIYLVRDGRDALVSYAWLALKKFQ